MFLPETQILYEYPEIYSRYMNGYHGKFLRILTLLGVMKFCYIDESGLGEEPYAVMAGVVVDAQRMSPTKGEWNELLADLTRIVGKPIVEIHTKDFYPGNGVWRGMDGQLRSAVISEIFNWFKKRKHHFVYSVVHKDTFLEKLGADDRLAEVGTLWRFMALHLSLAIQKRYQNERRPKGNTVLVFDNRERDKRDFTNLILQPPAWTDTYYSRSEKKDRLDMIIDVPHFVDSQHVGLIQLADVAAYLLRKHVELQTGSREPDYEGETEAVAGWIDSAMGRSVGGSHIYAKQNRCEAAELFFQCAPECVADA